MVFLAVSCSQRGMIDGVRLEYVSPDKTVSLAASSRLALPEVMRCNAIQLIQDTILVLQDRATEDNIHHFKAYSVNSSDYLGAFVRLGRGPGEMISPHVVKSAAYVEWLVLNDNAMRTAWAVDVVESTVSGSMIAADLLSNNHGGKGILLGGIAGVSPAEVVVIGAGTAGTSAARAAMALGASVKVFDNDIARLRQLHRTLGVSLFASNFHPNVLRNAFQSADVVIGALHKDSFDHHFVIAEELIETMKKGSLIIDLRVTQGGCFETTCCLSPSDPEIFEQHGVLHFCRPFISNYVARTASMAFSNLMVPLLSHLGDVGNAQNLIKTNTSFKRGVYLYQGKPVNEYISNRFNLRSNNIDIYLTAF